MKLIRKSNVIRKLTAPIQNHKRLVVFKINNKKINLNLNQLKFYDFEIRDVKIEVINHYLDKFNLKNSFHDHLFNHIFLLNKEIHMKSSLIKYLLDINAKKVEKISASFLSKEDYSLFDKFEIIIEKINQIKIKIYLFILLRKLITRKIESLRSIKFYNEKNSIINPPKKYTTIIRDWKLEGAEWVHTNKIGKSLENVIIYLKPDILSYFKSEKKINYIKYLRQNKREHFEYFPKINFYNILKSVIKLYFSSIPCEIKVNFLEVIIQRKWIDYFVEYIAKKFPNLKEFYTNEEYYTGTTYLTEKLKELNIKTINYAHGLGLYCPIVKYNEFYVFTQMQKNYYISNSNFRFYDIYDSKVKQDLNSKKQIALLFICQNYLSRKESYMFINSYKKIIDYIEKFAINYDIPIYAKYKPYAKKVDKLFSKNIKIIADIEDLPKEFNFIATTFASTYVMQLLNQMPFLIFNPGGKIDFKYVFPNDEIFYIRSYQELINKMENFSQNPNYYYKYWNQLIALFKEKK